MLVQGQWRRERAIRPHLTKQYRKSLHNSEIKSLIKVSSYLGFGDHAEYIFTHNTLTFDRLCGLLVRVSGYRYRGLGFDSRRYQIF